MVATETLNQLIDLEPGEQRLKSGVSWEEYEELVDYLDQNYLRLKVSYLDGNLEIMSPDIRHENPKERIATLIRDYCIEADIPFYSHGSTDVRSKEKISGKQPDTSFCIGSDKETPDLAVEVIHTSGSIKKIQETYKRLGVPELWVWKNSKITVYYLQDEGYKAIPNSKVLPNLPLELLAEHLEIAEEIEAIKGFRQKIRESLQVRD